MKTMKSMSEFVLWYKDNQDTHKGFINYQNRVIKYAQILQAEPQLWMFIPCDAKGEPIHEPKKEPVHSSYEMHQLSEYLKAKARCWFEGAELTDRIVYMNNASIIHKVDLRWTFGRGRKTIESLIEAGIELTISETLIKKLGL